MVDQDTAEPPRHRLPGLTLPLRSLLRRLLLALALRRRGVGGGAAGGRRRRGRRQSHRLRLSISEDAALTQSLQQLHALLLAQCSHLVDEGTRPCRRPVLRARHLRLSFHLLERHPLQQEVVGEVRWRWRW